MTVPARPLRLALALAVLAPLLGACRTGSRSGVKPQDRLPPPPTTPYVPPPRPPTAIPPAPPPSAVPPGPVTPFVPPPGPPVASDAGIPMYVDGRDVGRLAKADFQAFNQAWVLFVRDDARWPAARDAWLARGGAAPYVLSENLLRFFLSATARGYRAEVERVGESAAKAGEPAVGYFANLLILDSWPLREPVLVKGADGTSREAREWKNDSVTRRDLAIVLAAIGPPSVPRLVTAPFLRSPTASVRTYVLCALGRIATDTAVDAVASALADPEWTVRAEAVKGLGSALPRNPRARAALERARADPDRFVRRKAKEALSGRQKSDF